MTVLNKNKTKIEIEVVEVPNNQPASIKTVTQPLEDWETLENGNEFTKIFIY